MRIILVLASFLLIHSAHAHPIQSEDDASRAISDPGLLSKIGQVTGQITGQVGQFTGQVGQFTGQVTDKVGTTASELVGNAMNLIGVRYKRGGSSAETGFDCSGFVRTIYEQTVGLVLPRRANEQAAVSDKVDRSELQPGDLVFFNTMRRAFSHVGIYVGDGNFIHAPKPGAKVRVESMSLPYWSRRFDGARRVPVEDAKARQP